MTRLRLIRKLLPMLVCGGTLMTTNINCGEITVRSLKNGVLNWITGSAQQIDASFLGDLVIDALTGGSQNNDSM